MIYDYKIIPVGINEYITISNLNRANISKDALINFADRAYQFVIINDIKDFTIESLSKHGFYSDLFKLEFDNIFYESILKNSKKFGSCIYNGVCIFSLDRDLSNVSIFLQEIVRKRGKFEVFDFADYLLENYSIRTNTDKLKTVLNRTNLYYNSNMHTYYLSKEKYYEEVYND